jgi:hypothetical protein
MPATSNHDLAMTYYMLGHRSVSPSLAIVGHGIAYTPTPSICIALANTLNSLAVTTMSSAEVLLPNGMTCYTLGLQSVSHLQVIIGRGAAYAPNLSIFIGLANTLLLLAGTTMSSAEALLPNGMTYYMLGLQSVNPSLVVVGRGVAYAPTPSIFIGLANMLLQLAGNTMI